jgi:hypothetical protein
MRQRNPRLTHEDREVTAEWWQITISAVLSVVVALFAFGVAGKAIKGLFSTQLQAGEPAHSVR